MTLAEFQSARGLSLTTLAALLGRPVSTVHGWLHGTRRPDWASMEAILEATGGAVTANDFVLPKVGPPPGRAGAQRPAQGPAGTQAALEPEARALGLDPAAIAEAALRNAISEEKARRWAEENRAAIEAYNRHFEDNDTPLAEHRAF